MLRPVLFFVFALCLSLPARSSPVEEIRALALAGEEAAVEARMAELHDAALTSGDFDPLRAINAQVFATTDPGVIALLDDWSAAFPVSAYADAARAWNHYHRAYLLRGTAYVGRTPPQRMTDFREEIDRAVDAAIAAFERAPDYLPAADAMIVMSIHARGRIDRAPVFEAAMAEWPNWRTLHNMIGAERPEWGGSVEGILQLCVDHAEAVPDYDLDACQIEAVLTGNMPRDLRTVALELLADRDEPWLDYLKLGRHSLLMAMGRAGDFAEIEAMVERALEKPTVNVEDAVFAADYVARQTNRPFYAEQIRDRAADLVDAQIATDPFNPTLLMRRLTLLKRTSEFRSQDPETLARAWILWRDALDYGINDPEVWAAGGQLAIVGASGIKGHMSYPFFANAAALDPFSVKHLGMLLEFTWSDFFWAQQAIKKGEETLAPGGRDPFDVVEALRCPLLGYARLVEAYCALDRGERDCEASNPFLARIEPIRDVADIEMLCADVATAPVDDLLLDPVPPARLSEWSPETAPGMPGVE